LISIAYLGLVVIVPASLRWTSLRNAVAKIKTHLSRLARHAGALFNTPWLEQYGAICYRWDADAGAYLALLITARGSGRWVIPKGGPMKGKSPRQVAAREAFEEAGIKGKVGKKPIGSYSYLKRREDGTNAPCLVDVFALEVSATAETFKEHGQRQLSWVRLAEAGRQVEEPELRSLFAKLDATLKAGPGPP
jgi:8-oxo-dGTP pyrophosphatase MutT (NUDIX family)